MISQRLPAPAASGRPGGPCVPKTEHARTKAVTDPAQIRQATRRTMKDQRRMSRREAREGAKARVARILRGKTRPGL